MGEYMKHLKRVALVMVALTVFAGVTDAQKKTPRKSTTRKPAATKSVIPPLEVRAAREKVDTQLFNINQFIDVLGPIAQDIETVDASTTTPMEKNEINKRNVVLAIRNMKAGLANLETEFRTKPVLQKYLVQIEGITDLAARSEDSAIAGRFVASKDPLRDIGRKLMDTLAVMPK
jgi:hypothetical protein